jgi:hypothetical protein
MIKIIFRGKLVEGHDKSQVINNLSTLTRLSPEAVEQKLFSGKEVVIKKVDDAVQAEKYRLRFAKAGAVVEIVDEAVVAAPAEESPRVDVPLEVNTTQKSRRLITIVSGLVVIILAVLGGTYYWFTTSMLDFQVPATVPAIEQALAEPEMMAIAHINVAKSVELQNTLWGFDDDELVDPNGEGMFADLSNAGIDVRHSVTHLLAAFYVKEPQGDDSQTKDIQTKDPVAAMTATQAWGSVVLLGDFPVAKIRDFITQHYETQTVTLGKYKLLQFRKQDIESCNYTTPRVIQLSEHRLVVSEPAYAARLLDRLKNKSAAAIDIGHWQHYRSQHLFSVGIIAPKRSKHAAQGFVGMMIAGMQKQVAPVDAIYAGGSVEVMPPSLTLHASFDATQQAWIDTTRDKWQSGLKNFKQEMVKKSPPLARMADNLAVSSTKGDLEVALKIDRELGKNGREAIQDLLSSAFSISAHNAGQQPQGEQLDDNPMPFISNYSLGKLPEYRDLEFVPGKHSWSEGPFIIDVKNIALDSNDNIEIKLESEARGLSNLGKVRDNLFLHITDAVDRDGRSLLKQKKCGRDRNDKAEPFDMVMRFSNPSTADSKPALVGADGKIHYTQASANKTVHLADGVKLDDVAGIKGFIVLDQPTQLEIKTLPAPLAGQRVKYQGMQLSIKDSAGGNLSFNVSGDKTKLLNVRGLNKAKKPLRRRASSMGSFFGSSTAYSYDYAGEIAFVEAVLVKQNVRKRFPFEIHQLMPEAGQEFVHEYVPLTTITRRQFDARIANVKFPPITGKSGWLGEPVAGYNKGPLALAFYKPQVHPHFGAQGSIKLKLPQVPGLANNLSGIEILVDMITTASGGNHSLEFSDYIDVSPPNRYSMNGKQGNEKGMAFLEGQKNINMRYENDPGAISSIEGKIRLRLPTKLKHIDFSELKLGNQAGNGEIDLRLIGISPNNMTFKIIGDRSKLVSINMFNKDNKLISNKPQLNNGKKGWTAELSYSGMPARMEIMYATRQEVVSYPFELRVASH